MEREFHLKSGRRRLAEFAELVEEGGRGHPRDDRHHSVVGFLCSDDDYG